MTKIREDFTMESEPEKERRTGVRLGRFPLFLLSVMLLSAVAAIIVVTVLFVEQGQEISDLARERDGTFMKHDLYAIYILVYLFRKCGCAKY